jgi:hypothetical protein
MTAYQWLSLLPGCVLATVAVVTLVRHDGKKKKRPAEEEEE